MSEAAIDEVPPNSHKTESLSLQIVKLIDQFAINQRQNNTTPATAEIM